MLSDERVGQLATLGRLVFNKKWAGFIEIPNIGHSEGGEEEHLINQRSFAPGGYGPEDSYPPPFNK